MSESLRYFIPKYVTEKRYDKAKSIIFYALFIQILTSLIISFFLFFGADFIATNYFKTEVAKDVLQIFAFYFVILCIFQTLESFFVAVQDTFAHKIIEALRTSFVMIYVIFIFFL
ncbi:MAG: hypothetical protein LBQ59_00345 [Candidatus Peribacteria bacterium]|jgi:Na+-driven multidrug efflux pump|nr:hypothetical protein [Candidatus Peribacteria bacterium]